MNNRLLMLKEVEEDIIEPIVNFYIPDEKNKKLAFELWQRFKKMPLCERGGEMSIEEEIAKKRCHLCDSFGRDGCSEHKFPCRKAAGFADSMLALIAKNGFVKCEPKEEEK